MAPPEYTKSRVAHQRYRDYLNNREYHFKNNPRFTKNVDRLSSWLEFLLHPETHEYDREAFIPLSRTGGGQPTDYQWREVPEPVYFGSGQVGVPASESRFRSVLHEYVYSDFLDPILALSTQHVETGANILAKATAAVNNIYWAGETFTHELANFPSEWKGTASVEAQRFVARLEDVAGQLKLVVDALRNLLPKYGLVIKTRGSTSTRRSRVSSTSSRRSSTREPRRSSRSMSWGSWSVWSRPQESPTSPEA